MTTKCKFPLSSYVPTGLSRNRLGWDVYGKGSLPNPSILLDRGFLLHFPLKVNKSQKQNCRKKLLPKMNGRVCFSILMVRNHLKLEISISSFKYFRTVRIEKQIRPFIFGRSFFRQFCFWDLLAFSIIAFLYKKICLRFIKGNVTLNQSLTLMNNVKRSVRLIQVLWLLTIHTMWPSMKKQRRNCCGGWVSGCFSAKLVIFLANWPYVRLEVPLTTCNIVL